MKAQRDAAGLSVHVEDDGPGIPPAEQATIFEPFGRGDHARTVPGTGLGLTIARDLVAAHGGTLTVVSPRAHRRGRATRRPLHADPARRAPPRRILIPVPDSLSALRLPFVRSFALGRAFAVLGGQVLSTAVGWELYRRTRDPWSLGLVGLFELIPVLVFLVASGHVADRVPRRRVAMAAHGLHALAALGLAESARRGAPTSLDLRVPAPGRHRTVLRGAIRVAPCSWRSRASASPPWGSASPRTSA